MLADTNIPAPCSRTLRVGTCSWKYDAWKDLVYDPGKRYTPHGYLTTIVNVNNHYEGCAPLTIQRLLERLE